MNYNSLGLGPVWMDFLKIVEYNFGIKPLQAFIVFSKFCVCVRDYACNIAQRDRVTLMCVTQ